MVSVYLFVFWSRALTTIDPRVGIRLVHLFKSQISVESAAVRSKAVALFLLIYCLLLLPLFLGGGLIIGPCFVFAVLSVITSSAFISLKKRAECFTLMVYFCHVAVIFLCLFLMMHCVGLQYLIVAFPGHTWNKNAYYFVSIDNVSLSYYRRCNIAALTFTTAAAINNTSVTMINQTMDIIENAKAGAIVGKLQVSLILLMLHTREYDHDMS